METAKTGGIPAIDGLRYTRVLQQLHAQLKPEWYLEIGTFRGRSLQLAKGNFVAVDPSFRVSGQIVNPEAGQMHLFQSTSDAFFASGFLDRNPIRFDLAFLDGLHQFEALLSDFINAERYMTEHGVIVLHDCCPTTVEMTEREPTEGLWTGDVWKTLSILMAERPDLDIQVTNAHPTGLVLISGLDPSSTHLSSRYDALVDNYSKRSLNDFPGGLAGYFQTLQLKNPRAFLRKLAAA